MARDLVTFNLIHDFSAGPFLGTAEEPAGFANSTPQYLVARDSYEINVDYYERYAVTGSDEADFDALSTAKLYITFADVADLEPVELSDGTISNPDGTANRRVTWIIEPDIIPASFAGSQLCRLIFRITYTASGKELRTTSYQDVYVTGDNGDQTLTVATSDLIASQQTLTADTVLTAYPGWITYLVDASAASVTITLPAAAAESQQMIDFLAIDVTNPVTVQLASGTFRGTASSSFTIETANRSRSVLSDGTYWYHLQPEGGLT